MICDITEAPKTRLQDALKSAIAAFSREVADPNIGCVISEGEKGRHHRMQKAQRMEKANAKLSKEITNAQKSGLAHYN